MQSICINLLEVSSVKNSLLLNQCENSSMVEYSLAKAKVEGSSPFFRLGLSRLELLTLRLSGVYSNQLSYKPHAWKDSNSQLPDS
jgi:hypothetical protein